MSPDTLRLSPSIAKVLINQSPYHAWHKHSKGGAYQDDPTDAKRRGKLLDRLFFGVGPELVIIDADDFRTKAAKEARDTAEAERKIPVLAHKLAPQQEMVDNWQHQLASRQIHFSGESQAALLWESDGCPCKGILDHLIVGRESATIIDLKTCEDASLEACQRAVSNLGYDIQQAAYVEGVQHNYPATTGRVDMIFIFAEVEPPYLVNVVKLAGTFRHVGRHKWDLAKATWAKCLRENHWPGYSPLASYLEASPWQIKAAFPEGVPDELAASL